MNIKVTKAFVKELNKHLTSAKAYYREFSRHEYAMKIDYDLYSNEIDYSPKTGKFAAILIEYPDSYYAMPKSLTTRELNRIFRRESDGTPESYWKALNAAIAI